jgi:hypothetical protein
VNRFADDSVNRRKSFPLLASLFELICRAFAEAAMLLRSHGMI